MALTDAQRQQMIEILTAKLEAKRRAEGVTEPVEAPEEVVAEEALVGATAEAPVVAPEPEVVPEPVAEIPTEPKRISGFTLDRGELRKREQEIRERGAPKPTVSKFVGAITRGLLEKEAKEAGLEFIQSPIPQILGPGIVAEEFAQKKGLLPGEFQPRRVVGGLAQTALMAGTAGLGATVGLGSLGTKGILAAGAGEGAVLGATLPEDLPTAEDVTASALVGAATAGLVPLGKRLFARSASRGALGEIEKLLMPKLTKKERLKALKDGRIEKGDKKLFGGKKADVVLPAEEVRRASETVKRLIPDIDPSNQFRAHNQIQDKIVESARSLQPQLKATQLKNSSISEAGSKWKDLKAKQLKEPEFAGPSKGSFASAQAQFDDIIGRVEKSDDLAELWGLRIEYDQMIRDAVKRADDLSAPSAQFQKEMWLDNRAILNDILTETTEAVGGTAKKSFQEMNDLYTASRNIESAVDVDLEGKEGILMKLLQAVPGIPSAVTPAVRIAR